MLNRRHLRVKVLQALYAGQQSEQSDLRQMEKALIRSVDSVYEMYIWVLSLLVEVADYSIIDADERTHKFLPTAEDLAARAVLHDNLFIQSLRNNRDYQAGIKKYKINWNFDPEAAKSIFISLRASAEYQDYIQLSEHNLNVDKDIIKHIFKKLILKSAAIEELFEEKFINWPVDKEVLKAMMAKTFKNFSSDIPAYNKLADHLPNEEEDRYFILNLLQKVIAFQAEYQELISQRTRNWDSERIAIMDTLLMQMALVELVHFPEIPVKVTINEYIEISKEFSTPKSNSFINGILDKIFAELKAANKIHKSGKGLL